MTRLRPILLLSCIAWSSAPLPAQAQTVYRCGNSYSETPCPGGKTVRVEDARTPAQKAKADEDTVVTNKTAKELERERRAAEDGLLPDKRRVAGKAGPSKTADTGAAHGAPGGSGKSTQGKPVLNYFTALVPPAPKDKARKAADKASDKASGTP